MTAQGKKDPLTVETFSTSESQVAQSKTNVVVVVVGVRGWATPADGTMKGSHGKRVVGVRGREREEDGLLPIAVAAAVGFLEFVCAPLELRLFLMLPLPV